MSEQDDVTAQDRPIGRRIRRSLETALDPISLDIIDESHKHAKHAHMMSREGAAQAGGETHFRIKVVSERFQGKTRLERHRTINALVAGEMGPGKVHALAIEARAPDDQ